MSDIVFCTWVGQALPGDQVEYHRGFLGIDTSSDTSGLPEQDRRRLLGLARAARSAFDAGLVHLVQERLGPDRFAYLAVVRQKPRKTPVEFLRLVAAAEAA